MLIILAKILICTFIQMNMCLKSEACKTVISGFIAISGTKLEQIELLNKEYKYNAKVICVYMNNT